MRLLAARWNAAQNNLMKRILVLSVVVHAALAQTSSGTASIAGTILDAQTLKPVPAALVIASRAGSPPFTRNTKSGADGAFQIQRLAPGNYRVCVQAAGDQYLDPCQWNGTPVGVTLLSGQTATGIKITLAGASVLNIQVQDAQKALSQLTGDGRRPDLSVGVWGPRGLYYPAYAAGGPPVPSPQANVISYRYRLAVPRDTALSFYIASRDLKLGERVEIYCTTLDMSTNVYDRYYVARGEQIVDVWPIMGRGGAAQR